MAELRRLLAARPLVTVVGSAGTGKTRLPGGGDVVGGGSFEPGATAFVNLGEIRDGAAVPDVLAAALGVNVGQRTGTLEAVLDYLAASPHLLVMDNCEHLLGAVRSVVARS